MKNYKKNFSLFEHFIKEYNKPLVYLDSAATTLTPDCVVQKMSQYYMEYRSNIDRSDFVLSKKSTQEYEGVRSQVAHFIGADKEEIFFTSGATDSANKLVDMWSTMLELVKGDKVAVSILEHHAVYVSVIEKLQKIGVEILNISIDADYKVDIENYTSVLLQKPKLVFIGHVNNVVGVVQDIRALSDLAHIHNSYIVCDGSQAVGHTPVQVKELGVDSYFWSAHKMCGPTGVGVTYIPATHLQKMKPQVFGGGIVTSVSKESISYLEGIKKFEPGTQNIAGVIGLGEAVSYISNIGITNIHQSVFDLTNYLIQQLSLIKGITIYTPSQQNIVGIVSFSHDTVHTHDIVYLLGEVGVATRAGYHCAEPFVRNISKVPVTRFSLYLYNSKEDIDICISELQKIIKKFI